MTLNQLREKYSANYRIAKSVNGKYVVQMKSEPVFFFSHWFKLCGGFTSYDEANDFIKLYVERDIEENHSYPI